MSIREIFPGDRGGEAVQGIAALLDAIAHIYIEPFGSDNPELAGLPERPDTPAPDALSVTQLSVAQLAYNRGMEALGLLKHLEDAVAGSKARMVARVAGAAVVEAHLLSLDGWQHGLYSSSAVTEMALTLGIPERTAASLEHHSTTLVQKRPQVLAALETGALSWRHATIIDDEIQTLQETAETNDADVVVLETRLLMLSESTTASSFAGKARRERERMHPETIKTRTKEAFTKRSLTCDSGKDGMSWLSLHLPTISASAIYTHCTRLARAVKAEATRAQREADKAGAGEDCREHRTLDQLRADIAAILLMGQDLAMDIPFDMPVSFAAAGSSQNAGAESAGGAGQGAGGAGQGAGGAGQGAGGAGQGAGFASSGQGAGQYAHPGQGDPHGTSPADTNHGTDCFEVGNASENTSASAPSPHPTNWPWGSPDAYPDDDLVSEEPPWAHSGPCAACDSPDSAVSTPERRKDPQDSYADTAKGSTLPTLDLAPSAQPASDLPPSMLPAVDPPVSTMPTVDPPASQNSERVQDATIDQPAGDGSGLVGWTVDGIAEDPQGEYQQQLAKLAHSRIMIDPPLPEALVIVTVPFLGLMGLTEEPAELAGPEGGPISADIAQKLLTNSSSFLRVLTDPITGEALPLDPQRYTLRAADKAILQSLAGGCYVPNCPNPVMDTELDHLRAFEFGGPSTMANLRPACKRHHAMKHLKDDKNRRGQRRCIDEPERANLKLRGWTPKVTDDGRIGWIMPSGTYQPPQKKSPPRPQYPGWLKKLVNKSLRHNKESRS